MARRAFQAERTSSGFCCTGHQDAMAASFCGSFCAALAWTARSLYLPSACAGEVASKSPSTFPSIVRHSDLQSCSFQDCDLAFAGGAAGAICPSGTAFAVPIPQTECCTFSIVETTVALRKKSKASRPPTKAKVTTSLLSSFFTTFSHSLIFLAGRTFLVPFREKDSRTDAFSTFLLGSKGWCMCLFPEIL